MHTHTFLVRVLGPCYSWVIRLFCSFFFLHPALEDTERHRERRTRKARFKYNAVDALISWLRFSNMIPGTYVCHGLGGGGRSVVPQSGWVDFVPTLMRRVVHGVSNRSREKNGIEQYCVGEGGGRRGGIKRPRKKKRN